MSFIDAIGIIGGIITIVTGIIVIVQFLTSQKAPLQSPKYPLQSPSYPAPEPYPYRPTSFSDLSELDPITRIGDAARPFVPASYDELPSLYEFLKDKETDPLDSTIKKQEENQAESHERNED